MDGLVDDITIAFRQLLSLLPKAITGWTRTIAVVPVGGRLAVVPVGGRLTVVSVGGRLMTIGFLVEDGRIRRPSGGAVSLVARRPCQVGGSLR